jgi:hypothetical protein
VDRGRDAGVLTIIRIDDVGAINVPGPQRTNRKL